MERDPEGVGDFWVCDAVIPDQRPRLDEYLPKVGGVGERLGVPDHAGVEDYFASDCSFGPESLAEKNGAILKNQSGVFFRAWHLRSGNGRLPDSEFKAVS